MLTGPNVILALKVAVAAVTVLLVCSLVALAKGHRKLHGRINIVFFTLTFGAVLAFEVIIRLIDPTIYNYIHENKELRRTLTIHLCFSIPAFLLMPVMLFTGLTGRRSIHIGLAVLFGISWVGLFITGIFFLPHHAP